MRKISLWLSLAFIFTIPWEVVIESPGLGSVAKLAGLVMAAFWAVTIVITGRFRKPSPFHYIAYLYVLWNILSIFWSTGFYQTLDRVITFVQLLLLAFILWDLFTERAALLAGLQMYILGIYVALGSTVVNYVSNNTFYYQRFSAGNTNPDDLGALFALGIPVACYLVISNSDQYKAFRLLTLLNYAYIPLALAGISLSGTRTALIASAPGLLFALLSLSKLRVSTRIAFTLFLIFAIYILYPLIPLASFQRLGTIGTEIAQGDFNGRKQIWQDGLDSFVKHPLLGVGSNMFRSVDTVVNTSGQGKVAHNTFLSILVEVGLVGLALFLTMIIMAVIQALKQPPMDSSFWLSVLATWAIIASALTWEYRKPTWLFLSLAIVSAASIGRRDRDVQEIQVDETVAKNAEQSHASIVTH